MNVVSIVMYLHIHSHNYVPIYHSPVNRLVCREEVIQEVLCFGKLNG